MAFSRDMVDTNFGDSTFGPKWRSSLAVYYYLVPEEDTADVYPNSRIVYLKFTCSITGYNPSETLANARQVAEDSGALDDLQRSAWEVISGSGWSAKYWPCLGAIMQLAVYPGGGDNVGPDDYPYILDFEPKKREMFEAVTEGSEYLSGSSAKTEITKGSTNVNGLEIEGGGGFSFAGFSAGGSVAHTSTDTTINQNTTDTSREARETLSRTTQSSQMYQLFNGYHLGSNRALFVIAPRPHTVSGQEQTEFNLIDGARKLEGIQEVFVVVHMPKTLVGFCVQAGLDTGHQVTTLVPYQALMLRPVDDGGPIQPNGGPEPPVPPVPPPNPHPPLGGAFEIGGIAAESSTLLTAGRWLGAPAAVVSSGVIGVRIGTNLYENYVDKEMALDAGSWVEEKTGSRILGATAAAGVAVGDAVGHAPEAAYDYVKDNVTLDPDEIDWDRTLKPWKWF
jgi:hypothetical protein